MLFTSVLVCLTVQMGLLHPSVESKILIIEEIMHRNATEDQCPIWSKSTSDCQCDQDLNNVVICNVESLKVQACYCVYFDESSNNTIIGYCMFTCALSKQKLYYTLSRIKNGTNVNEQMCTGEVVGHGNGTHLHRTGRLCGKCEDGYGLPVYSYHFFQCIKCHQPSYKNWLWYFAMALGPLTIFYFIVMIFEINATSGRLNMYVFFCQVLSMPVQLRLVTGSVEAISHSYSHKKMAYLAFSFYGIWNLDFFRMIYNPFCIHPELTALQVIALDYIIAIYPVFLTFITYVFLWIHLQNFRIVLFLWKPFYWCLRRFKRHWNQRNTQTSLIKVFATFLLLSYVKLLGVSVDLLVPTRLFDGKGSLSSNVSYWYYDATVEMFGPDHLPYAILAIFVLTFFTFCPLILFCLYPCRCFQKFLNFCCCNCQALHTFMDVYTGIYRYEPRDWRYFAAFHVLGRIFSVVAFNVFLSLSVVPVIAMLSALGAFLIAIIQPNRIAIHNTIDIALLLGMTIGYLSSTVILFSIYDTPDIWQSFFAKEFTAFIIFIPLLYPIGFGFRYIYKRVKQVCMTKICSYLRRQDSVSSLPDRMVNEEEYPPLLGQGTSQSCNNNVEQLRSHCNVHVDTY